MLANEIYERNELGEDPLNINGWLNDIDAEDASIDEILDGIIKDDSERARIQNMIVSSTSIFK